MHICNIILQITIYLFKICTHGVQGSITCKHIYKSFNNALGKYHWCIIKMINSPSTDPCGTNNIFDVSPWQCTTCVSHILCNLYVTNVWFQYILRKIMYFWMWYLAKFENMFALMVVVAPNQHYVFHYRNSIWNRQKYDIIRLAAIHDAIISFSHTVQI